MEMGALAPKHTEPEGVGLPHRAPRRACAVIGNVFNAADSNSLTGTQGVEIDLHIKTRGDAPYKTAGVNYLKDDANGTPTFGELNLQGPDALGTRSVALTFAFKRRDTGAEVEIPFMQFTLFDFDHNYGSSDRKGEEVRPLPPAPPTNTRPPTPPSRFAGTFLFEVRFGAFSGHFFQTCVLTLVDFSTHAV